MCHKINLMKSNLKKITIFLVLFILITMDMSPILAITFKENQTINLQKDHECASVLKVQGKDMLKQVIFVTYLDPTTGIKQPAFCVEPEKEGIGTGAGDNYDVTLQLLHDERLWRILYKGYMGSKYTSWGLECDDDLYYATKTAIHCLVDGSTPKTKYEIPHRVGRGEDISLEEVQRRGKKVLEVAQQLYDYGINGTENYSSPTVSANKKGEAVIQKINSTEYLVQSYNVTGNRGLDSYNVSIKDFPQGTIILNNLNIVSTSMNNSAFKIAVPTKEIKDNIKGKINITDAKVKTYPVFYAEAYSEERQDYITYADSIESASTSFNLDINAYKSSLKLVKMDKDTKQPLQGVIFSAKYADNNQTIGEFTTNTNGEINITGLRQGKIVLTEKSTLEEYELDTTPTNIELEYNQSKEIQIYNDHKKGNVKVVKVDKDDNDIKLEGVEFDLIDKEGKVVSHLTTNSEGEATATEINTGEYVLREIKTKEEYKIAADQEVKITWKDTCELTIENVKKKGKIQITKVDKENNEIKLQGVKFKVLDGDNNEIESLETDENGEAITSDLPIGTYFIQEVATNDKYILKDEKIEVKVNEDEISSIIVENEKIKGKIKIVKTSEDKNNILNLEAGSPIEGAKFNIYDENNKLVEQVTTNKEGIAISSKLNKGKYTVQEVESGKWYILNTEKYSVEITENNEMLELKITNKSEDPKVDISKNCKNIIKSNEEIDYKFTIKNTGNTNLTDFTWYDILPSDYAKITKISTGIYNQDISYSIYYKTNKKDEYMVVKKDLSSKENTYIDLSNIHLEEGEKITEIKVCFENVKVGFESIESPHIYMKANDNLENDTVIKNDTILEGYDNEYKVCDEDTAKSSVYNVIEQKKLPRTGF